MQLVAHALHKAAYATCGFDHDVVVTGSDVAIVDLEISARAMTDSPGVGGRSHLAERGHLTRAKVGLLTRLGTK